VTLGDLYEYASKDSFGLTFCAPIRSKGKFFAALCYDILPHHISTMDPKAEVQSFEFKPLILQREK